MIFCALKCVRKSVIYKIASLALTCMALMIPQLGLNVHLRLFLGTALLPIKVFTTFVARTTRNSMKPKKIYSNRECTQFCTFLCIYAGIHTPICLINV